MAATYGYPRHRTMLVPGYVREEMEYPGFDRSWVLGREGDYPYYEDFHYSRPRVHDYRYSRPLHYSSAYYDMHDSGPARLAWPTEIPLKVRLSLYSDGNKLQLEKALRDIYGVCDVAISGLNNALATVTGTASSHQILKVARQFDSEAEIWSDASYRSDHSSRRWRY